MQLAVVPSWVSQLVLSLLQSAQSLAQVITWQVRFAHVGVALAIAQPVPHVPQFDSVLSGVSQPSR